MYFMVMLGYVSCLLLKYSKKKVLCTRYEHCFRTASTRIPLNGEETLRNHKVMLACEVKLTTADYCGVINNNIHNHTEKTIPSTANV
jgi:hypothetical protein